MTPRTKSILTAAAVLLALACPAKTILLRPVTAAAPVGLVEHMAAQLASRTNGATAEFLGPTPS